MNKLLIAFFAVFMLINQGYTMAETPNRPLRIVALGDSLTAGYGLQRGEDFATRLQLALTAKGYMVKIDNGGISGDTSAGGLRRMDALLNVTPKPDLLIIELGANDLIQGITPSIMESNLRQVLQKAKAQNIPAILTGMVAPFMLPPVYRAAYNKVFPDLASEFDVPLYPFFLEGVAFNPALNLPDGAHPNKSGIDVIVSKIMPIVTKALDKILGRSV